MKRLFDQNLSPKLAVFFAKTFIESKHLQDLSLDVANDSIVIKELFNSNIDMIKTFILDSTNGILTLN